MHPDINLVTYIDMHIDRPLDFQSVDVRNPQRMHLRTLFGHHHSHSTSGTLNECTYAHYSVITTGQVNPRLRQLSKLRRRHCNR